MFTVLAFRPSSSLRESEMAASGAIERPPSLALLTAVRLVTASHAHKQMISSLPHVTQSINLYLDATHKWTLESASRARHLNLLDRLLGIERPQVSAAFRQARFRHATKSAAALGSIDVLQWWRSRYLRIQYSNKHKLLVLRIAMESGQIHVLQWLLNSIGLNLRALEQAHEPWSCQHSAVIHWVYDQGLPVTLQVSMDQVAKRGDLDLLIWLHGKAQAQAISTQPQLELRCTIRAMYNAAQAGRLDVLKWMHESKLLQDAVSEWAVMAAAKNGHWQVIQWLLATYPAGQFDPPYTEAVSHGHVETVHWIVQSYPWQEPAQRQDWIARAIDVAAETANWDLLSYLLSYKSTANSEIKILNSVASTGDLEMVKWAHAQGFGCTMNPILDASVAGSSEIVQWLSFNRADPIDTKLPMDFAALGRHLHVLEWLHHNRSEGCSTAAVNHAAVNGDLPMIQWLSQYYSDRFTHQAMDKAAAHGHLDVVRFLHEHRQEGCGKNAMDQAAARGFLDVVQWLHANRSEGCTSNAINKAVANGHRPVVGFLMKHYDLKIDEKSVRSAARNGHFAVLELLQQYAPELMSPILEQIIE